MKKNIVYLVIGMMIGAIISPVFAKRESSSVDAASVVGYGKTTGGVLVAIKVSSDGTLQQEMGMKKLLVLLLMGILVSSPAFAKRESSSEDATSVVLYGKTDTGTIVPIKVSSDGKVSGAVSTGDYGIAGIGTDASSSYMLSVNGDLILKSPDGITSYPWNDSLDFFGCGDNNLCWKPNATTGVFGIQYSGGVQISMEYDGTNMVLDTTSGGVSTSDYFRSAMQTVTVASNGAGTAATGTVTPTTNNIRLQCNDTDGCTMSMSETGAQTGIMVTIVNNTSNTATFADSSGVLELAGGASFAMGINDALTIFYQNSTWLEVSRSDN